MNEIKKRYDYLDILKALAILFVIIYHFHSFSIDFMENSNVSIYINYYFFAICSVCVPLFFFINGALLLNKNEIDIKKHTFNCLKIFGLVVIWSFISIAIITYLWTAPHSIRDYFNKLCTDDNLIAFYQLKGCYNNHLWFLIALFGIYIFYPIIYVAFKNNKKVFIFFLIATMIFTFVNTFIGDIVSVVSYFTHKNFQDYHNFNFGAGYNPFRGICGFGLGAFLLGGLLFYYREKISSKKMKIIAIPVFLISTICLFLFGIMMSKGNGRIWDICFGGYSTIFTLINVVCLFVIFLDYQVKSFIGKFICLIGKQSLGIYLIHLPLGTYLMNYWSSWKIDSLFLNILFGIVVLIISFIISYVISKTPYLKKIVTI
jgi:surface polysaccharide O-acyltransferase-like enzyme